MRKDYLAAEAVTDTLVKVSPKVSHFNKEGKIFWAVGITRPFSTHLFSILPSRLRDFFGNDIQHLAKI
jgi:hypothetical protein